VRFLQINCIIHNPWGQLGQSHSVEGLWAARFLSFFSGFQVRISPVDSAGEESCPPDSRNEQKARASGWNPWCRVQDEFRKGAGEVHRKNWRACWAFGEQLPERRRIRP
jgi:hypothetical protein